MSWSRLRNRVLAKVFGACPALAARWGERLASDSDPIPWAVPRLPLGEATVALVTTGGVHLKTDVPFDMEDPDGDPSYRVVPVAAGSEALAITHDYYDHADAERDPNLVLPIERLRTLCEAGAVGRLHPAAYSFMGHIDGPHVETLRGRTAREVAAHLRRAEVDYALLVPA